MVVVVPDRNFAMRKTSTDEYRGSRVRLRRENLNFPRFFVLCPGFLLSVEYAALCIGNSAPFHGKKREMGCKMLLSIYSFP